MERVVLLYSRELPGGGIVMIEALTSHGGGGGGGGGGAASEGIKGAEGGGGSPGSKGSGFCRGRISVERRVDPKRREGHTPPVIAEVDAPSQAAVFQELYRIASDNVAIARGLIQWQARRHGN
jgi:hypothetical protein